MSIANIPGGWLFSSRMLRLPITARWSYVAALLWCHNEESDGFIRSDDLHVIPGFDMDCIPRLQDQDILVAVEGGWKLQPNGEAWENSQSTKEQVDQARLRNRERQAKLRERRNGVTPPVTTEVTNEVSNEGSKQNKTKPNQTSLVVTKSGTETEKGPKRASRLPEGWQPPESTIRKMRERFPHLDLRSEHEKFCNYWLSKSGRDATKVDWARTWINWIITAAERSPNGHRAEAVAQSATDRKIAFLQSMKVNPNGQQELE